MRTYDRQAPYPEEINRQIIARIAQLHFAPTLVNKQNLLSEHICDENIIVTGNTVVDALQLIVKRIMKDKNYKNIERNILI